MVLTSSHATPHCGLQGVGLRLCLKWNMVQCLWLAQARKRDYDCEFYKHKAHLQRDRSLAAMNVPFIMMLSGFATFRSFGGSRSLRASDVSEVPWITRVLGKVQLSQQWYASISCVLDAWQVMQQTGLQFGAVTDLKKAPSPRWSSFCTTLMMWCYGLSSAFVSNHCLGDEATTLAPLGFTWTQPGSAVDTMCLPPKRTRPSCYGLHVYYDDALRLPSTTTDIPPRFTLVHNIK